jgi:hypothetical protein
MDRPTQPHQSCLFAAGDVLWHNAELAQHLACKTASAELQTLHVSEGFDLFAIPAAHLSASVAHWEVHDVVFAIELAHEFQAVALVHPGGHLTAVQAERNGAAQSKHVVHAEEVIRCGVHHLGRALLDVVNHACDRRHELATGMHGNLEFTARHFANFLGKGFSSTINGVQRLREAGSQAPTNGFLGVNCGCDTCSEHTGNAGIL